MTSIEFTLGSRPQTVKLQADTLCLETQGRDLMAKLVHDVVAEAMRLNLHDGAVRPSGKSNDVRIERSCDGVGNG